MAYPNSLDDVDSLFDSRGAQIYWRNWTEIQMWYRSYMLPEMTQAQEEILKERKKELRRRKKKRRKKREDESLDIWHRGENVEIEQDNEVDVETTTDDMSPEYLEFHRKTLKHRDDLRKLKETQKEQDSMVEYIPDDQGPEEKPTPSTAPPDCRPGIARMKELEVIYGSAADRINMIETRMQAKFDEFRTRKQPKLWPVIPLNL